MHQHIAEVSVVGDGVVAVDGVVGEDDVGRQLFLKPSSKIDDAVEYSHRTLGGLSTSTSSSMVEVVAALIVADGAQTGVGGAISHARPTGIALRSGCIGALLVGARVVVRWDGVR